jgi:schlafen family protein
MTLAEAFDDLDWAKVMSMIEGHQEEHLQLEFKTINAAVNGSDDLRQVGRCLSGFANSSGGILIWGVQAKKNADGVDSANSAAEISNTALLLSRLNTLTGELVSPLVDGVRHRALNRPESGSGFVATLVPESSSPPHMARRDKQYYKRSGDSFYGMEHFDLEDMFGRRQKPRLELSAERLAVQDGVEEIIVHIANSGRALARHVGFVMTFENAEISSVRALQNLSDINSGRAVVGYTNDHGVIHPNGTRTNTGSAHLRRKVANEPISVDVTFYCEGIQSQNLKMEIPPSLLQVLKAKINDSAEANTPDE